VLFRSRTRHAEKRLEKLVQERTTIMQQTLVKLETASKAKSQFLANMSHEIRTPMNAILGIAEIQLQRGKFELETEEALTKIYNSGNLLLGIINDILDLSKIEAGKLELSPCQYEVASAINDTVMLNMMRIGSKHIEFKLSVDENIPVQLIGDELRIKQILNNLLSNAFKYTEKGEVTLSISVEKEKAQPENVMLMFRVSDTGQGMTKEQIEKLFDEYARFNTEANRTTEGTGLGMSITRNLIQMMDGDIAVKSEAGRGSVFTVRLPQGRAGSGVLGKELAEGLTKFERNAAKQMRKSQIVFEPMPYGSILLVDDVESNLYVAKGLMAPYEMSIDTVMSGFEAIEKIKEGKVYDIVFMDHMMPKMDGIEAAQRIRALGYAPPIVALTANAIVGQADVFLANGFDGFISKPIDVRQLNAVLKKFVRDKQPPEVIEAALKERVGKTYNANSGAPPTLSPELAEIFVRDATKAIDVLEGIQGKGGIYEEYDLRLYTINTHAMKSALANISENDLSAVAAKLEQAGRAKDVALMANETQAFLDKLRKTIEKLAPQKKDASLSETATEDLTLLREKLLAIKEVCDEYDRKAAKDAIAELRQKKWLAATGKMLETMSEHLLNGDFEEVASVADKLLNRIGPA
jgi:CheY-like chemotaxis protein/nitrogen-specific signal transduction histidine kinase/HPt (histidine-containing phosphotransfer) domain-containing protein